VVPRSVGLSDDCKSVAVRWPEGDAEHASEYRIEWLLEHAYAPDAGSVPEPPGDAASLEVPTLGWDPGEIARECLAIVERAGVAVVRGGGADTEAWIERFAAHGLRVIETHFGRIEDLRTDNTTNRNTDQLGYTDAAVDLHTDQPFLAEPPRYQLLHCMRAADWGGDNAVADARAAAEYLRRTDAPAFEILASAPIRFHRRQQAFEKVHVGPLLEIRDGALFRVRSSYFTMDPQRLPFERMEAWYRAYQRFERLTTDPKRHYSIRLDAGDFLFYDNFRMLHARTRFGGARWVRGVYFDR
jgi:gamma-butyrobetaine dioxygenase/trimethyllysine dioxygenase